MSKRLLVIGGNAAGLSTASQVKRLQPSWEVIVFEKGANISYAPSGVPYFLSGRVADIDDLIELTPNDAVNKRNIDLRLQHEVIAIHPHRKRILVHSSLGEREEAFDFLMIATGSIPLSMGLDLRSHKRVFTLKTLDDGKRIKKSLKDLQPKKVAVIGGGYIGLELLETMKLLGLETHFIHRRDHLARVFEKEVSDKLKEKMVAEGILLKLHTQIHDIKESLDRVIIETQNGRLEYDMVFLGLGVSPANQLAKDAGITLGVKEAIKVNPYLETNWEGIYAGGDCTEAYHLVGEKYVYTPLAPKANKEGFIAGLNISGQRTPFQGIVGTSIVQFFDIGVARTGLTHEEAKENFHPIKYHLTSLTKPSYYPNTERIHSTIVIDKDSGRLLGVQLIGPHDAIKRIDVYATALYNRMTIGDIFHLDLAYAPPFSPVYDPVLLAARIGRKKI